MTTKTPGQEQAIRAYKHASREAQDHLHRLALKAQGLLSLLKQADIEIEKNGARYGETIASNLMGEHSWIEHHSRTVAGRLNEANVALKVASALGN